MNQTEAELIIKSPSYQDAGFTAIAKYLDCKRRNAIAVEHYKKISSKVWRYLRHDGYEVFSKNPIHVHFADVEEYCDKPYPTANVLAKLVEAKDRRCFDSFYVMSADKDPILLGIVKIRPAEVYGTAYVIATWGKDISLSWLYEVAK